MTVSLTLNVALANSSNPANLMGSFAAGIGRVKVVMGVSLVPAGPGDSKYVTGLRCGPRVAQ